MKSLRISRKTHVKIEDITLVFDKITLFLTDLFGFILYSRSKVVFLRQTLSIIKVWQI